MGRVAVAPIVGEGMVVRRIVLRARDVVFFKGIIEASEGLAAVFAERGGDLTVAAPLAQAALLDRVIGELCEELGGVQIDAPAVPR